MKKPTSIEVINKVLAEIGDFDSSSLSIIRADDANSYILIKDHVTGALLKYTNGLGICDGAKWSYTCKFGEFRCRYLDVLVNLLRGVGLLSLEGSSSTPLPPDLMYLTGVSLKNSSGKNVSLGKIFQACDKWGAELPRIICGEVSNEYRKYTFGSYWDAWEYSTFYIMSIMHNYKFPSWAARVALFMEKGYSPVSPSYSWINPSKWRSEYRAPKYLLLGAYALLFFVISLIFLTELVTSYFPHMLLSCISLSWAYVWGSMVLGSPSYLMRERKDFINHRNVRFPIYKSILYFFPAVVLTAIDEIINLAKLIRSAIFK